MGSAAASRGGDGGRVGWRPGILALFVTAALGLSVLSSLDCEFWELELAFVPRNYARARVGIGLWSYEAPDGRCLSYADAHRSGGFAAEYSSAFVNEDVYWSTARILALACALFGSLALISILINIRRSEPRLVDVLVYLLTLTLMSECAKIGIFRGIDLCTSLYWYNVESHELSGSIDCGIDRGAIMSLSSIAAYLVPTIVAVGFAARRKSSSRFVHDDASLRSWDDSGGASTERHATLSQSTGAYGFARKCSAASSIASNLTPFAVGACQAQGQRSARVEEERRPNRYATMSQSAGTNCHASRRSTTSTSASHLTPMANDVCQAQGQGCARMAEGGSLAPTEEDYGTIVIDHVRSEACSSHMQSYPPANRPRRVYDDTSTLTFDPGY